MTHLEAVEAMARMTRVCTGIHDPPAIIFGIDREGRAVLEDEFGAFTLVTVRRIMLFPTLDLVEDGEQFSRDAST